MLAALAKVLFQLPRAALIQCYPGSAATLLLSAGGKQWVLEPSIIPLPALRLSAKNVQFFSSPALYHTQSHPSHCVSTHLPALYLSCTRNFLWGSQLTVTGALQ